MEVSGDAFVNERRILSGTGWRFDLPKPKSLVQGEKPSPTSETIAMSVPHGWVLIDGDFLKGQHFGQSGEKVLQYFDGRPPDWEVALSKSVPRRRIVSEIRNRFIALSGALKPAVNLLLGAGGEGKSTAFMQTLVDLVRSDNWIVLYRYSDDPQINPAFIDHCAARYDRVLVASDDAHSLAPVLAPVLERLKSRSRNNVHFFLCARTIDWRAEAHKEQKRIVEASDYHELVLRGLERSDAADLVDAWSKFGKAGLNELFEVTEADRVDRLLATARDIDPVNHGGDEDEGVLLGAMLQLRYGDKLKDKVRSILYRLKDIPGPNGPLLDVFAMIASMHAEGMRFLSVPVLAEALGCSIAELRRKVINPLADEAIAAGGGRFVLCRHRAIAKAAVETIHESNLYGDTDRIFPLLARSAVIARSKGAFVPDLHKWDYTLPEHFDRTNRIIVAVEVSEALLDANPADVRLRVNLSKTYRTAREPRRAVDLFKNYAGDFSQRAMWTEWGVAQGMTNENPFAAVLLNAAALCDLPQMYPPSRSESRAISALAQGFLLLYDKYAGESYRLAALSAAHIGLIINSEEMTTSFLEQTLARAVSSGPDIEKGDWISHVASAVTTVSQMVDVNEVTQGRLLLTDVTSFKGLSALLQHCRNAH